MQKHIQNLSIAVILLLLISACSKEKKIEKQIIGDWEITAFEVTTRVGNDTPEVDNEFSPATVTFNKDNTGTSVSEDPDKSVWADNFTWANTEDILTLEDPDTPPGSTSIFIFNPVDCDIVEQSKEKLKIFYEGTVPLGTEVGTFTVSYTLTKK